MAIRALLLELQMQFMGKLLTRQRAREERRQP
jgi:hypothetical protein